MWVTHQIHTSVLLTLLPLGPCSPGGPLVPEGPYMSNKLIIVFYRQISRNYGVHVHLVIANAANTNQ